MASITFQLDTKPYTVKSRMLSERSKKNVRRAVLETALEVLRDSKRNTPVATGFLCTSNRLLETLDQGFTVIIGNTASYAVPVHDGSARGPARPFMADAIKGQKVNHIKRMERALSS